jgi:hypothetical protein
MRVQFSQLLVLLQVALPIVAKHKGIKNIHDRVRIPKYREEARPAVYTPQAVNTSDETLYHATFDQLIDYENPSLGIFPQVYYYRKTFWEGPGSPVRSLDQ